MCAVFAVDACRTPIGKIKGALAGVRPDHLTAEVIAALIGRNPWLDPPPSTTSTGAPPTRRARTTGTSARMGVLLAGLPVEVPGATVNRLCGSGMEAIARAARAIAAGDADICLAGGTESMTRAPFVLPRGGEPFPREAGRGRHQARLAAGQPEDGRDVPADHARRDGGERRRQVRRDRARQDEFALRSHQARPLPQRRGTVRRGNRPCQAPAAER